MLLILLWMQFIHKSPFSYDKWTFINHFPFYIHIGLSLLIILPLCMDMKIFKKLFTSGFWTSKAIWKLLSKLPWPHPPQKYNIINNVMDLTFNTININYSLSLSHNLYISFHVLFFPLMNQISFFYILSVLIHVQILIFMNCAYVCV